MTKRRSTRIYTLLALIGLATLLIWPSFVQAVPLTATQQVQASWYLANDLASYDYQTDLTQTIHPTNKLVNLGRESRKEHIQISGYTDQLNEQFYMKLDGKQALEMKVEGGQSYGRAVGSDEWELLNGEEQIASDMFAPNGDPLGFLAAADKVQIVPNQSTQEQGDLEEFLNPAHGQPHTLYSFEVNGPRYAEYMRELLTEQLRTRGELPAGMTVGLADVYVDMTGHGQLWISEEGLPLRLESYLEFPPTMKEAREWVSAEFTTNFSNLQKAETLSEQFMFAVQRIYKQPSDAFNIFYSILPKPSTDLVLLLGLSLLLGGVVALMVTYSDSTKVYTAFSLSVIISMVVTPLMRGHQVNAYYDQQSTRQMEHAQTEALQAEQESLQTEILGKDFNPRLDPLAKTPTDEPAIAVESTQTTANALKTSSEDEDEDEINDTVYCDAINDTNDDEDGDDLNDNVECYELGTWALIADTDGDLISDGVEVEGVTAQNGGDTRWYLNPLDPDSNGDGLTDLLECADLETADSDGNVINNNTPTSTECPDTDGDGVPDLFDYDNDGDGVPDSVDSSPFYIQTLTTQAQEEFSYNLTGYNTNKSILVNFELRPPNESHLYQTYNVLDWQSNDTEGQVTRVLTNTWADYSYTSDSKGDNGDMMLIPMLEITVPAPGSNSDDPSGGLPVLDSYGDSSTITNTTALTEWLDTDTLDEYSIEVSQDEETGELYIYLPLYQLEDSTGETPVGWAGQMYYRPEKGWGNNHTVKMVWLVNAMVDECDTSNMTDDDSYDEWCSTDNTDNWTTSTTIIQSYYEEFYLTGLSVREDQGFKSALITQDDALSKDYADDLWALSYGLSTSFGEGMSYTDTVTLESERFDIDEIEARFGPDNSASDATWGLTPSNFSVTTYSYSDQVTGLDNLITTDLPTALNSYSANTDDIVTALIAREETYRSINLDSDDVTVTTSDSLATIELDLGEVYSETYATLSWNPYQYDGSSWAGYDYEEYIINDLGDKLADALSNSELNDWLDALGSEYDDLPTTEEGVIGIGKNYYLLLALGDSELVEASGRVVNDEVLEDSDLSLGTYEGVLTIATVELETHRLFFEEVEELGLDEFSELLEVWSQLEDALGGDVDNDSPDITFIEATDSGSSFASWLGKWKWKKHKGIKVTGVAEIRGIKYGKISTGLSMVAVALYVADNFEGAQSFVTGAKLFEMFSTGIGTLKTYKFYTAYRAGQKIDATLDAIDLGKNIAKTTKIAATAGIIVDVALGGILLGVTVAVSNISTNSLEFTALLATFVAQVILAIVTAIFSLLPGGALVIAVLELIDAVIAFICQIIDAAGVEISDGVQTWVCNGIMGAITEIITLLIFEQTPLVNLSKNGRIDLNLNSITLSNEADGFRVGNSLELSGVVTSTLYFNKPDHQGQDYWSEFNDNNLQKSQFGYDIQDSKTKLSVALPDEGWIDTSTNVASFYSIPSDKQAEGRYEFTSDEFTFTQAGLNMTFDELYLSESFKIKALECWFGICSLKNYKDSVHSDLREEFVYDVFPATFDEFVTLESTSSGQRLAWDEGFPILDDADGDGLPREDDPDDGDPDYDNDGLNDYWEYENGYNPSDDDADCDGLTDYWEAFYNSDPNLADTDGDGLADGLEVYHPAYINPYSNSGNVVDCQNENDETWIGGWEIVYDYDESSTSQKKTRVNADPIFSDADGDNIFDRYERVYGYNPNVKETVNVLSLEAELESSIIAPKSNLDFSATIKNELDSEYASGLLEGEHPIDTVQVSTVLDTLAPQESVTLNDSLSIDIDSTQATSVTLRAGAIIENLDDDKFLWLKLNEAEGSTTFADSSLNGYDGRCSSTACPDANGSNLTFEGGSNYMTVSGLNQSATAFSIGFWLNPASVQDNNSLVRGKTSGWDDLELELTNDNTVTLSWTGRSIFGPTLPTNTWSHVMLTYDPNNDSGTMYFNGVADTSFTSLYEFDDRYSFIFGLRYDGAMDDIQIYDRALSATEVQSLVNAPVLDLNMNDVGSYEDDSNWSNDVSGDYAPSSGSSGAIFDQLDYLEVSGDGLDLEDDEFTFSMWINPEIRNDTFHTEAEEKAFTFKDNNRDWQGVFGNEEMTTGSVGTFSSYTSNYPSLYVNEIGGARVRFGTDNGSICTYEIDKGVLTNDSWQYLTITYDREAAQQWAIYLNGSLKHESSKSSTCEDTLQTSSSFYIGRPNPYSYVYFDKIKRGFNDGRIDFGFTWKYDDSPFWSQIIKAETTHQVDEGTVIDDHSSYEIEARCDSLSGYRNCGDKSVDWTDLTGGSTTSEDFDGNYGEGTMYWSISNDYFQGQLDDFEVYNYALSGDEVETLYNTNYLALELNFDEPPGSDVFSDDSGNDLEATCDSTNDTCPDTGLAGRDNQALRFDGDDDYVQLSSPGFDESLADEFTAGLWFKLDEDTGGYQRIIHQTDGSATGRVWFGISNGDKLYTFIQGSYFELSDVTIKKDKWYYTALTYEDNMVGLGLYDGTNVYYETSTGAAQITDGDLYLGAAKDFTSGVYLHGWLDDLTIRKGGSLSGDIPTTDLALWLDASSADFADGESVSEWEDLSGNDYHATQGTSSKQPTYSENPTLGAPAISFDGSNDQLEVDRMIQDDFTIFVVFASEQSYSDGGDTHWHDGAGLVDGEVSGTKNDFGVALLNGKLATGVGNPDVSIISSNNLDDDKSHIVIFERTKSTGEINQYVDGSLIGSDTGNTNSLTTPSNLAIGSRQRDDHHFEGEIAEVIIYAQVLSDDQREQVQAYLDSKYGHSISPFATVIEELAFEAPVLNLHLDESVETTTFTDETPYANNATCTTDDCPEAGLAGRMREAAVFQGGEMLELDNVSGDEWALETFTLSAWVQPEQADDGAQVILNKVNEDDSTNLNFRLVLEPDTLSPLFSVRTNCTGSSSNWQIVYGSDVGSELTANQWSHLAATYDGSEMILYVNGAQVHNKTDVSNLCVSSSNENILIGQNLTGNLDEVAIYGRAMTTDDVSELFDYQSAWYDIAEEFIVQVDADGPVFNDFMVNDSYVSVDTDIQLSVSVTDSPAGLADLTYSVNGGSDETIDLDSGTDGGYAFTFTATNGEGTYKIDFTATDAVGNQSTHSGQVTVDNTAGSATFTAVSSSSRTARTSTDTVQTPTDDYVTLSGAVSDSGVGLTEIKVWVSVYDGLGNSVSGRELATVDEANGTWTVDYRFGNAPYGTYTVKLMVEDRLGNNSGENEAGTLTLDGYGPVGDLLLASDVLTDTTVTGVVSDPLYSTNNRVLHFHFEETSGATEFVDSSGNAFHASCATCPTAGQSGEFGSALEFTGSENITIDNDVISGTLDVNDADQTVMAWIYHHDSSDFNNIVVYKDGTGTAAGWALRLNNNNQAQFFVANGSSGWDATGDVLSANTWYHMAGVIDRREGEVRLYVDGILVDTQTDFSGDLSHTSDLLIGSWATDSNWYYFDGLLDEVAVYNTALSDQTIYQMANPTGATVSEAKARYRHASGVVWPGFTPDDVALYLPLDTGNPTDFSLNAHEVSCDDCPTFEQDGQNGLSAEFDGTQYLELTDDDAFDFSSGNFTQMAWIYASQDDNNTYHAIMGYQNGGSNQRSPSIYVRNKTGLHLGFGDGSTWTSFNVDDVISQNTWHHVATTFDGTTYNVYVDGTSVASNTSFAGKTPYANTSFRVGYINNYFEGLIDEVTFFNRALSEDEIDFLASTDPWQSVTLSDLYSFDTSSTDLTAYLPLDTDSAQDQSSNGLSVTCSNCPTFEQSGKHGNAALFDGTQYLELTDDDAFGFSSGNFTQMAWIYPAQDDDNTFHAIMGYQNGGSNQRSPSIYVRNQTGLHLGFGDGSTWTSFNVNNVISQNTWHHVATTFDGQTYLVYVDGIQVGSSSNFAGKTPYANTTFKVGAINNYFEGLLDEVALFSTPLSADEINEYAALNEGGSNSPFTTWSTTVPSDLADGPYQIDLLASDSLGNTSVMLGLWNGEIDTQSPELTFSSADLGSGYIDVTCSATDFNLDETSWNCPVGGTPSTTYSDADSDYDWLTDLFTDTSQLVGLHESGTVDSVTDFTACDSYGHCATASASTRSSGNTLTSFSRILTPTMQVFTSLQAISVGGLVSSDDGIQALNVTANGEVIHSETWPSNPISATWTTSWTPASEGTYNLVATLTTAISETVSGTATLYIDLSDPTVSIATSQFNQANVLGNRLIVTGTADDATALARLEAKVDDGPWRLVPLTGGTTYTATVPVNGRLTADSYDITVRATDHAGRTASSSQTIPFDISPPTGLELTVQSEGQPYRPGQTIVASNPALVVSWNTSDAASYTVEWLNNETTVVSDTLPGSASGHSYQAISGQKLTVRVTAIDATGNIASRAFGPIFVDDALTPLLGDLTGFTNLSGKSGFAYEGWLTNECTLLGVDQRRAEATSNGGTFNHPQQLQTSWNSEGLRLAWQGADWRTQGDLFVYLDTVADSGATTAYNPFDSTDEVTVVLPTDLRNNSFTADYLVWVREVPITETVTVEDEEDDSTETFTQTVQLGAVLLQWDGDGAEWQEVDGEFGYRLDTQRPNPLTDIYLPFSLLGISDPANQSLGLVALASEEEQLKLWATLPAANNLNSETVVNKAVTSQVESFALINQYQWSQLGDGICPNQDGANGIAPYNGAALSVSLVSDPAGVGYSLFDDQMIFAHRKLFAGAADWTAIDNQACADWRADPERPADAPPPPACRPLKSDTSTRMHPRRDLRRLMNTDTEYLAQEDEINLTVTLANNGTETAHGVRGELTAPSQIRFIDGVVITTPLGTQIQELLLEVGDLPAGESRTFNIPAQIDLNFNPGMSNDWTHIKLLVFDETGSRRRPNHQLHLDHPLDTEGPSYVELTNPTALVKPGATTFGGVVIDDSPVPTVLVEVGTVQTTCSDSTPSDTRWSCELPIPDGADGQSLTTRVKAIDVHGQESDWFDGPTLTLDTTTPVVTATDVLTGTLGDGLIGPDDATLIGTLSDNRFAHSVQVCEGGSCASANVLLDATTVPTTTYIYRDNPAESIVVDENYTCPDALVRTFNVADEFIVADLDVGLLMEQTNRNDMVALLTSPSGTLSGLVGQAANVANLNVLLDDAASTSIYVDGDQSQHGLGSPFFSNVRRPHKDQLAAFRGENAQGTWLLELCDNYDDEDTGLYYRSELRFTAEAEYRGTNGTWQQILNLPANQEAISRTYSVYGVDQAGNESEPMTFTVNIDTKSPVLSVDTTTPFSPTRGTGGQSGPITLAGTVNDANLDVMRLTARTPNGRFIRDRIPVSGQTWQYSDTTTFNRAGLYCIWVEASDEANNQEVSQAYALQVEIKEVTNTTSYEIYLPIMTRSLTNSLTRQSDDNGQPRIFLPLIAHNLSASENNGPHAEHVYRYFVDPAVCR